MFESEIIYNNLVFFIFILNIHIFYKIFYNINELALWYLIHSLANFYIIFSIIEPIKLILNDPLYHLFNMTYYYDSTIKIVILHLYHMLFFKCTKDDIFHHVVFVSIGTFTIYFFNNGYFSALTHFFICGLPGGIDYFLCFLYKTGCILKNTRLKWAMFLNVWIRSPGLCMLACFAIINFIYSKKTYYNYFELFLELFLTVGNGQMYMSDVVYTNGKNNL